MRPSQFILSYGIGSVIETDNGSRIIPSFDRWGKYFLQNYTNNEIKDPNAEKQLTKFHKYPKIFAIPANSELTRKEKDSKDIYRLEVFPRWGICMKHTGDPLLGQIDERNRFSCPACRNENIMPSRVTGIRFVLACQRGHLDDVDWPQIVHSQVSSECDSIVMEWVGEGQTSNEIRIRCRKCSAQTRLSNVYRLARNGDLKCTGRYAESNSKTEGCGLPAQLLLRSGSNLRIPDIQVSLSLPYRDSALYRILSDDVYYGVLSTEENWTKESLLSKLRHSMIRNSKIKENHINQIEEYSEREILLIIDQVYRDKDLPENPEQVVSESRLKKDEFLALVKASKHSPYQEHGGKSRRFEVDLKKVSELQAGSNNWNIPFIVTPIKTLSVLLVQRGYRREVGTVKGELVPTYYEDETGKAWFPGIETTGEGIFVYAKEGFAPPQNEEWQRWTEIFNGKRTEKDLRDNFDTIYMYHPLFVWWHSLSHRIINSLSIDSGYSSASIRERIYIDFNNDNTNVARGGILLYAAQTGGDGTLGGLISQASNFEGILKRCSAGLRSCSNDPLCSFNRIGISKENGAACYTCMLLSETSCEFRNRFLDRNIL